MKLRYKALILIGLPWISFLAIIYFKSPHQTIFGFIILGAMFFLLTLILINQFIIKRIERLNKQIKPKTQHITMKGHDEITSLATEVNTILATTHDVEEQVEKNVKDRTIESETESNKEFLNQLSQYDSLTSLPNRIFFNETLNKSISHASRRKKTMAILIIDIDSFKTINTRGHTIGDKVLIELANRFANTLRSEDVLARLDGDEFIVLLNDITKPKFASAVAEKILSAASQPIKIDGQTVAVTASIGISIFPDDGDSLEDLLKNADLALHKAKQGGGKIYQFYTEKMDIEAREYIQLETALRKAIVNDELVLYFQPILHIKKGNITGVEALIRWMHPELGIINPGKFIPVAEETGLITQIGEWTIREACKTNKYWQNEGYEHLTVSVNLSPKQFYQPDITNIITKILNETGLSPNYLELEITESIAMDNADETLTILEKIKSTGVQISIDHFGTGYTSISHLKLFPVSSLKIDQGFIKGIPNNPNDSAITSAVIALAHNLGMQVVAEGVETGEQVQYLATQNCDMVQGYFLSHPMPASKIVLQFKKLMDEVLLR